MKVSVVVACLVLAGLSLHRASFGESAPAPQVSIEVAIVTGPGTEPKTGLSLRTQKAPAANGVLPLARRLAEENSLPGEYPAEVTRYAAVRGPLNQRLSAIVSSPFNVMVMQEKDGKKQLVESELHIGTLMSALTTAKNDELAVNLTLQDTEHSGVDIVVEGQTVPGMSSRSMSSVMRLKNSESKIVGKLNDTRTDANQTTSTWKLFIMSARLVTDDKSAALDSP